MRRNAHLPIDLRHLVTEREPVLRGPCVVACSRSVLTVLMRHDYSFLYRLLDGPVMHVLISRQLSERL
jgi:hypothetical protein